MKVGSISVCLSFFALLFVPAGISQPERPETIVRFPRVAGYEAVTDGPQEHFYASYYGINSWNRSERYATVLETSIRDRLPSDADPATLGLVDMETKQFLPLLETRAWNFQQGCMAHWLGTDPESQLIFNDLRDGKFVSVIFDIRTRKELRVIPWPVSAVSPDGTRAVSINFARLRRTRPDYGYGGRGQAPREGEIFPGDDGLFLVDLETGTRRLLVSIADVKELVPDVPEDGLEYFNHTLFSRDGSKVFWLARAIPERNTTALTVNVDGTGLRRCFPDGWSGSHFDWLDGENLMITSLFEGKIWSHVLFTVGRQNYRRLGRGLLDYDGHGTFSPDGKWMVTDTYPNKLREQHLFLMDMESEAVLPVGRFVEPEPFGGEWRCDLHPRWSSSGRQIGFNSTFTGSRQAYVLRVGNQAP